MALGGLGLIGASAVAGEAPESILSKLEDVYVEGDLTGLDAALAPDFTFTSVTGDSWDRKQELAGHEELFRKAKTKLEFTRDFSMRPAEQPGTWVLERVPIMLTTSSDAGTYKVRSVSTIWVRRNAETGVIQIYRWVDSSS
jgi:hypothetical protein